jgi:uncharacterized spore protein YtfJ
LLFTAAQVSSIARYDKLFSNFTTGTGQGEAAAAASGKRPKSAGGGGGGVKVSAEEIKVLVDTNEHYVGFYRSRLQARVACDV